ncbi:MAG: hypothetical protein U5K71_16915 [Gracilimonas sp.]|nr:hypothetical protein [Gracilimonas sp.]
MKHFNPVKRGYAGQTGGLCGFFSARDYLGGSGLNRYPKIII